jgi:hypothetical protein
MSEMGLQRSRVGTPEAAVENAKETIKKQKARHKHVKLGVIDIAWVRVGVATSTTTGTIICIALAIVLVSVAGKD